MNDVIILILYHNDIRQWRYWVVAMISSATGHRLGTDREARVWDGHKLPLPGGSAFLFPDS